MTNPRRNVLVSFDIDGTLEDGDPPGPLPMDLVRLAKDLGYVVGSASDRTKREQSEMWRRRAISVDFIAHKHHLDKVALDFPARRMIHIGDTDVDAHYRAWRVSSSSTPPSCPSLVPPAGSSDLVGPSLLRAAALENDATPDLQGPKDGAGRE